MTNLPGYPSKDTQPLPSKADVRQEERGYKALRVYYGPGGSLSAVRKALNLKSNADAQVVLNRALRDWRERNDDAVLAVQYQHATTLEEAHRRLSARALGASEQGEDMDLAAYDRLMKTQERQAKLHASDAEKDAPAGPIIQIIRDVPPWEKGETIDGTIVDDKQIGEGS